VILPGGSIAGRAQGSLAAAAGPGERAMVTPPPSDRHSKSALIAALENRLGDALGPRLGPLERLVRSRGAVPLALGWLLLNGAAAILVLLWANQGGRPEGGHARLASLIAWNAIHLPPLIVIARLSTIHVLDIVRRDVLPFASGDYAEAVRAALAETYAAPHVRIAPYAVAVAVVATSLWTLRDEIAPVWWTPTIAPDLAFWTAAIFLAAVLNMKVVVVAVFPRAFAAALEVDQHSLYPPAAADSPLVRGLARLNRALLAFWAASFAVLASIMLLALLDPPFGLGPHSPYLFILIPLFGFFSIGLGTHNYLASEAAIATTLRRFSLERAAALQREIAPLLERSDDEAGARLDRLTRLHDQVIAGGRYGSRFWKIVSIALPLALPAVSLAEKLFG
jgi:hypothetical protein